MEGFSPPRSTLRSVRNALTPSAPRSANSSFILDLDDVDALRTESILGPRWTDERVEDPPVDVDDETRQSGVKSKRTPSPPLFRGSAPPMLGGEPMGRLTPREMIVISGVDNTAGMTGEPDDGELALNDGNVGDSTAGAPAYPPAGDMLRDEVTDMWVTTKTPRSKKGPKTSGSKQHRLDS